MSNDWTEHDLATMDAAARRIGREIFASLHVRRSMPWHRRWWDEQLMNWAIADDAVKVQMFRFVDVLPTLKSSAAVVSHLREYFQGVRDRLPRVARLGLATLRPDSFAAPSIAKAVRAAAQSQARRFIAGANVGEVRAAARRERNLRRAFTLDILGEAVTSEREADRYFQAYRQLIEGVAPAVNSMPEVPQIDRDARGALPRANVSVKLSALDSQADEIDRGGTSQRIAVRLRELLRAARAHHAFLNVDMESYHIKDLTLRIFEQVLLEDEFRDFADVGIAVQCYLPDADDDLRRLCGWARRRGTPVSVRIVKGAYWDYETVHARANGWPLPVFEQKWESDANFERQSRFLLRHADLLRPAVASHNIRSLAYALAVAEHVGLAKNDFELQMLYGMANAEKRVLVDMGYRVRTYMPYGQLIPGMGYLVRRLLENTSNDSFLRASFREHVDPEILLMNPLEHREAPQTAPAPAPPAEPPKPFWQTYKNEPPADFAREENRQAMQATLESVKGQLGRSYPLMIGGQAVETDARLESRNPSHKTRLVGSTAMANAQHVDQAVNLAREALPNWAAAGAERRAEYLRRAAEVMRRRRFELAAFEVYECGKGWREADGDVCEAIDFCEYYAAGAIAMDQPGGLNAPGEENEFIYFPRGVAAVIAPWNFPLAILTGMTTAALATGNTVVMKPAEQSPVVAAQLMEIFREVELPPGVLHYLPGAGEVAGAALVEHPDVALIAFTGSREVGLAINARAAEISRTSTWGVKRVIAEMGGKNAIIVDDDADLDEAVVGVMKSAFGYQGQKCSACSRAIVLDAAYDTFLSRLVEATRSLRVGPAEDPATSVGPVIDEDALRTIHEYIELGRKEGREALAVDVGELAEQGYFVGPHIYADMAPDARLAQEEVFGPVLAVIRAANLDEAIRMANSTQYALTGGIYSRSPANLERAAREMAVGNLYLNRACTGALVARQPFGGFKMSGIGSKAGGPDYLLQFVLPKTITENTMRRGFAPSEE